MNKSNHPVGKTQANATGIGVRVYSRPTRLPGWLLVSRPAIVARHEVRRAGQAQSVPTDMNVEATIETASSHVKYRPDATPIFHELVVEAVWITHLAYERQRGQALHGSR